MNKQARSIDGILLKPSESKLKIRDNSLGPRGRVTLDNVTSRDLNESMDLNFVDKSPKPPKAPVKKIERLDIDDDVTSSLRALNEDAYNDYAVNSNKDHKKRKINKLKKSKKEPKKHKKSTKIIIAVIVAIILAVGGFFVYKILIAGDNIFEGGIIGLFNNEKLAEDENGRSNILIFGTTPIDDDGPMLADTVLVLSINQTDKTAYMVSLPRDLYVEHYCPNPLLGTTAGKLNETYKCVYDEDTDNESEAANEFRNVVGEITGLNIHYYVHLSYEGVQAIIDAVGGIDIMIESEDPRGIYDYYTDVKYGNGETVHLSGWDALVLARSRGAGGGYGFESFGGSNYFRERTQQKILQAVQAKALSSGTLSNPIAAMDILTAMGKNLRTNFKTSEIRSLISLANDFKTDDIVRISLRDAENDINLTTSDMINGASVEIPMAGKFNYTEIQKHIAKALSSNPVVREAATIDILNGSDTPGLAQLKADELEALDYNIDLVSNAPDGTYSAVEIYQINATKTATAKALEKKYNVKIKTDLPVGILGTADFVIIFGAE